MLTGKHLRRFKRTQHRRDAEQQQINHNFIKVSSVWISSNGLDHGAVSVSVQRVFLGMETLAVMMRLGPHKQMEMHQKRTCTSSGSKSEACRESTTTHICSVSKMSQLLMSSRLFICVRPPFIGIH